MQIHELNTFSGTPGELDYLAIDSGFDTAKISAARFLETKVNQPKDEHNQYTNGEPGQLLRTNGDGSTEWSDVGLPTDEQTAQAVSDWLNDHPEATTTVADGSLTESKFSEALKLKTIKDYVTPEMFGAVGDGVTDDTNSFAQFISYIEANNCSMYVPKKTYLADIEFSVSARQYDFGGATLNGMITIAPNSTNITIKNINVNYYHDYCAYFSQNVYSITFIDCRFGGAKANTEQLHFEKNTWAFKFINCSFIGGATKAHCVLNGALSTNEQNDIVSNTMLFVACHFYNFTSIKYQEILASSSLSFVGGYIDETDYVAYSIGDMAVQLMLSGVDVEFVQYVYYATGYSNSMVSLSSCYGTPAYIGYTATGFLNINISGMRWLTYTHIVPSSCLNPSVTGGVYVSINGIKTEYATPYMLKPLRTQTETVTVYVPPNSTIKALEKVYMIEIDRKADVNTDIDFYDETGILNMGAGYWYNRLTKIYLVNNSNTGKTVTFDIKTPCILSN